MTLCLVFFLSDLFFFILCSKQAASPEDQSVPGVPRGQSRQDQLHHHLPDQPGLPARCVLVCETCSRIRDWRAPAENRTLWGLWVRRVRRWGETAAAAAGWEALTSFLRADPEQGRERRLWDVLLPSGGVADLPRWSVVSAFPGVLGVHEGSRQATGWVDCEDFCPL